MNPLTASDYQALVRILLADTEAAGALWELYCPDPIPEGAQRLRHLKSAVTKRVTERLYADRSMIWQCVERAMAAYGHEYLGPTRAERLWQRYDVLSTMELPRFLSTLIANMYQYNETLRSQEALRGAGGDGGVEIQGPVTLPVHDGRTGLTVDEYATIGACCLICPSREAVPQHGTAAAPNSETQARDYVTAMATQVGAMALQLQRHGFDPSQLVLRLEEMPLAQCPTVLQRTLIWVGIVADRLVGSAVPVVPQ